MKIFLRENLKHENFQIYGTAYMKSICIGYTAYINADILCKPVDLRNYLYHIDTVNYNSILCKL